MKNILVVGGAGYIGSHTVRNLIEYGYNVIVLDNLSSGHIEAVLTPNFEKADLMDKQDIREVFRKYKIEAVVHFAAFSSVGESVINPAKYYTNNVMGTLNLLEIMREFEVKNIVFSSTAAVFGNPEYTPIDENHLTNPINPYGASKLMIERIMSDYNKSYGLRWIALRYFNAAGAANDGLIGESHNPETHLIPLVLKTIKGERDNIKVFGDDYETEDGTCIRDYIYVADLAEAHRLALLKIEGFSGVINLGTGVGTSVFEIIKKAEQITGKSCSVEIAQRRAGDPAVLCASNKLAEDILGWKPVVDIDGIISSAWLWEVSKKF